MEEGFQTNLLNDNYYANCGQWGILVNLYEFRHKRGCKPASSGNPKPQRVIKRKIGRKWHISECQPCGTLLYKLQCLKKFAIQNCVMKIICHRMHIT